MVKEWIKAAPTSPAPPLICQGLEAAVSLPSTSLSVPHRRHVQVFASH